MSYLERMLVAPPSLVAFLLPYTTAIGLPHLAEVAHIAIFSCLVSIALQRISSIACPILFPKTYPKNKAKSDDWDLHVVGWAYSIIATPLALYLILHPSPEIIKDQVYGFSIREARLSALATGYFLWDLSVSAMHIQTQGLGFFLHGAGCFLAFLFTLKPFLMYCGPNFLIWELSTIFLNIHWYLDKFGMTGSTFQLINGFFLLSAYISARLLWGTYQSYALCVMLFGKGSDPTVSNVKFVYAGINIMLNGLNFFWFRSMVNALRKRFNKSDPNARKEAVQVDGKLSWKKNKKVE